MSRINHSKKPVIGLLGGVGAGKTTVAGEFKKLGCAVIDVDAIGHRLLEDPVVRAKILSRWGQSVFTSAGAVDRRVLGALVFDNPDQLKQLNEIMWPAIRSRLERRIEELLSDPSLAGVVVDAAVLLEAGWEKLCTHLVFVRAEEDDRAQRVQKDRGWDHRTWRLREKSQISLDIKAKHCLYSIESSSNASRLCDQVCYIYRQITST